MHLLDALWTWLRCLGREKPPWYHGEDQISIVVNGRSWSSEDGTPFPEDFSGWAKFERGDNGR